jgi:uncharacterized protein YgiM (DUF1202 family)
MRIFFQCLLGLVLLTACSTASPTPNIRGVTVVPHNPVPSETEPFPIASPTPVSTNCPDVPVIRLMVQERGRSTADNTDPVNLRNGPGTNYDIITRIESGEIFYVLDGPSCADGYAWFYVRYRRGVREFLGWIAEGSFQNYFVEPYVQG